MVDKRDKKISRKSNNDPPKQSAKRSNGPTEIQMNLSEFRQMKRRQEEERKTSSRVQVDRDRETRPRVNKTNIDKNRGHIEEKSSEHRIRKKMVNYLTIMFIIIFLLGGVIITKGFTINTIRVTGNVHYTEDEIREIVTKNGYINNSLLLFFKNKIKPIQDVPFVDKMDIEYISSHTITITVYEKAMAGCVEYMNEYVYFDKDGIVLETSQKKMVDIPCITGMSFESMTLHSKLPIEDEKRFKLILNITQLLDKYDLNIEAIRFTSEDDIILYYGDIKVLLGEGGNVDEQLVDLGNILEKLQGKKGTLDMTEFTTEKGSTTFKLEQN